jgi:hypothetical protein
MNSVHLLKGLRYYLAANTALRTLLGTTTNDSTLARLLYKDSLYASSNEGGTQNYPYPHITFKLNDDDPKLRFSDDNSVYLELTIENLFSNSSASMVNLQIKDCLKELLEDSHSAINAKALTLTPPLTLKVRDIAWVSARTYDEKEQGTERVHKYICIMKLVVGD